MDFFEPCITNSKGIYYIKPKFNTYKSKDLMIRGGDFYAIWDEENKRWSKDQDDAIRLIDNEIRKKLQEVRHSSDEAYVPLYMWDADSGIIDRWNKYVRQQLKDNFQPLDNKLIFSNSKVKREDYSTHRLNYPLEKGCMDSYDELMSTLYDPEERHKLEWAIGCVVSGDSTWVQKFIVIVGDPGTGKSTFFKILRKLFSGYIATINAKSLGDSRAAFALEPLKNDPLVAIEDDAKLDKITDNTRLNSLISHEPMVVNEKNKSQYENTFHAFVFLGSNTHVQITDSASGLTRRLIDVKPSGRRLEFDRYNEIMGKIDFELGAIAEHCLSVYNHSKKKYNDYVPVRMLRATNLMFTFLKEKGNEFVDENNGARLVDLWNGYKLFCEESKIKHPHDRMEFRNEIEPYFSAFKDNYILPDGRECRSGYFVGFKWDKIDMVSPVKKEEVIEEEIKSDDIPDWLKLDYTTSVLDEMLKDCPAQLTKDDGTPKYKWDNVKTKLNSIDTKQLHYVKVPENHIVIDFDIKDESGNKSRELNLKAAKQFPPTYAEWSKSGAGIHLHYIYKGDVAKLSSVYDDNIEVKKFTGNSSLRRMLSGCNMLNVAELSSGLPLKGDDKLVFDKDNFLNEKALRTIIKRNLKKEYHAYTTPSVQFIKSKLDEAYANEDLKYDVSDLRQAVYIFCANSSNQSEYCLNLFNEMHFKSKCFEEEKVSVKTNDDDKPEIVYDVEVFMNLFLVCWKYRGAPDDSVIRLFNPSIEEIENLYLNYRLDGFNNRGYDAHIMRAWMYGYSNIQLYNLSKSIIASNEESNSVKFSEAYTSDHLDAYDIATKKQSLKKWEIELNYIHFENAYDWDKPLPKDKWEEVGNYCANDVNATDKVFDAIENDVKVRLLISEMSGLMPINTNRQHITRIIFGKEKNPNLVYTNLATGEQTYLNGDEYKGEYLNEFPGYEFCITGIDKERYVKDKDGKPLCTSAKSIYMKCDPSEGGYVLANPGMYGPVWCFDVSGLHPASLIAMNKFGEFTSRYAEIRQARLYIKHKDYESAKNLPWIGPYIGKYLTNDKDAKAISNALKLILNSTYGFCSANFANPFKDPRDEDNIVAKRGALFMISLKEKVIEMGYTVIHCKTDSIKVVNPDERLCKFITDFGKKYGYEFEIEHKFDRICLVNRSTYIGLYSEPDYDKNGNEIWWDATGAEFQHPYIYKTCFTHEPIIFEDYCETKSVASGGIIYLDMNDGLPDVTYWERIKDNRKRDASKLTKKAVAELFDTRDLTDEQIEAEIAKGHNYIFIGRISQFVPVVDEAHGGELVVKRDGKFSAVAGTKGYRWLEATAVKALGIEHLIDKDYYRKLVDDAIESISEYGDYNWFANAPVGSLEHEIINDPDIPF